MTQETQTAPGVLIIEIETGNAAFADNPAGEVARILCGLAAGIEYNGLNRDRVLMDINGNRVGRAVYRG